MKNPTTPVSIVRLLSAWIRRAGIVAILWITPMFAISCAPLIVQPQSETATGIPDRVQSIPTTVFQIATPTAASVIAPELSSKIAFVSERRQARKLDIWLLDPATNETMPITSDEALDNQPRWSPDGRLLAFRSQWPDHHSTIRIYDVVTGELIELDPGDNPFDFDWLQDEPGFVYANGEFQIHYLYLDGRKSDAVIQMGRAPAISPDGDKIAYIGTWPEVMGERLGLLSLETESVKSVIDDPSHPERGYTVGAIEWSPRGQRIVEARQGSRITVPSMVVYDTDLQPMASLPISSFLAPEQRGYGANLCSPTWLGDSDNIVFVFEPEDSHSFCVGQVYVADSDLQSVHQLTPGDDFASPSVSPDGRKIVMNRGAANLGFPANNIYLVGESSLWIMESDGNGLRLLADGPGYDGEAVWQPYLVLDE